MDDELDGLRDVPALRDLLAHYTTLAANDKQAWHDRHKPEGESPRALSRLHGELIANGWIELNPAFAVTGCYRATRAGIKALERAETGSVD